MFPGNEICETLARMDRMGKMFTDFDRTSKLFADIDRFSKLASGFDITNRLTGCIGFLQQMEKTGAIAKMFEPPKLPTFELPVFMQPNFGMPVLDSTFRVFNKGMEEEEYTEPERLAGLRERWSNPDARPLRRAGYRQSE